MNIKTPAQFGLDDEAVKRIQPAAAEALKAGELTSLVGVQKFQMTMTREGVADEAIVVASALAKNPGHLILAADAQFASIRAMREWAEMYRPELLTE